jgi:hypothetical protein
MQDSDPEEAFSSGSKTCYRRTVRRALFKRSKPATLPNFQPSFIRRKVCVFSPYASVLLDQDRVIRKNQLAQMWASAKRSTGGATMTVSGDPIRLSFRKYHRRFIFDHDFSHAESVNYNPASMGMATLPTTFRPFIQHRLPSDTTSLALIQRSSGMDWSSLWLVFEKKGSEWYLVGIVHESGRLKRPAEPLDLSITGIAFAERSQLDQADQRK